MSGSPPANFTVLELPTIEVRLSYRLCSKHFLAHSLEMSDVKPFNYKAFIDYSFRDTIEKGTPSVIKRGTVRRNRELHTEFVLMLYAFYASDVRSERRILSVEGMRMSKIRFIRFQRACLRVIARTVHIL